MLKKFDVQNFQKKAKELNTDSFDYIDSEGTKFELYELNDGYGEKETPKQGLVYYYHEYYKDGSLSRETTFAKTGGGTANIGQMKSFSTSGKEELTMDFEKDFKIKLEDVIEICKKKGINLDERLSNLNRSGPGEHPLWYVSYNTRKQGYISDSPVVSGPTWIIQNITIDGVTGEIKETSTHQHLDN